MSINIAKPDKWKEIRYTKYMCTSIANIFKSAHRYGSIEDTI